MPPINLDLLEQVFSVMERNGVSYGYGVKAPSLSCDSHDIQSIDCSGFSRYAIAKATDQQLIIPDGSQAQRDWAEQNLNQVKYGNLPLADPSRLFIAFIKPFERGCGDVGHVWFVTKLSGNDLPWTMESHGGGGCTSRPYNYHTLWREVYSCFELPVQ